MSYPNLHLLLRATNRRVMWVGLCQTVLIAICLFLVGLLIALAIDAVFALPSWGLIALDVVLLSIGLLMLIGIAKLARRNRFDARRVARLLEHRLGITDSSFINSIELREGVRAGASRKLVQQSVERGEERARHVAVEEAIQSHPARRAALWATSAAGLMLLAYWCAPSVFGRGITRLIDPTGDHPAFTLVDFDVEVTPETIYHGEPATIQVNLAGPDLPDRADLVFMDGDEAQRIPMYSSGPNEYLLTLDRVERSADFYIDTPKGRSERYRLQVRMVPLIESARVTYRYPEYTQWSEASHDLMRRDIRALEGTEIEVEVKCNLPVARGWLRMNPMQEGSESLAPLLLEPDSVDPTVARGTLTLHDSAQGTLEVFDESDHVGPNPLDPRIIVIKDQQPRIEITEPDPVVVAVENWQVPVKIEAIDDVEIRSLQLNRAINGFQAPIMTLADQDNDRKRGTAYYQFDLAELGARPGDLITYYATAFDNHPSGEHFASTDTYVIQVISMEEYTDYMRRSYRMEELQQELNDMAEELSALQEQRDEMLQELESLQQRSQQEGSLSEEEQNRLAELKEQLEAYAEKARELANQMSERMEQPQLYDMEQSFREMLKEMSESLNSQADAAEQLNDVLQSMDPSSSPSPLQQQELSEAMEKFQQQSAPFDQDNQQAMEKNQQQADAFQKADRMLAEAERIRNVIQQQRELADRLQQFQNAPELSPEQQRLANRMAREQEMLRQELEEAVTKLELAAEQAAETLPKTSADASKLCQGIRGSGVLGDQDSAAMSARQGDGGQAHQSAEVAAQKLESFASQCEGAGQGAGGELDSGLSLSRESIGRSLQQLSQGRALPGMSQGKGRRGNGSGGSMSKFSLHGPNAPRAGRSEARSGRMTGEQSKGEGGSDSTADSDFAPESMDVEARFGSSSGAGNLQGVPVGYRDQAEAYFRRLADESDTQ